MVNRGLRCLLVLALVAAGPGRVLAQESIEEAARRLGTAHAERGNEGLARAVRVTRVDLWLIVERLGTDEAHASAEAVALLAPKHVAFERLPEYAAWRKLHPMNAPARQRLAALEALARARDDPELLAAIDAKATALDGVSGARVLALKTAALRRLKRPAVQVVQAFHASAKSAAALGWMTAATRDLSQGLNLATKARLHQAAAELAEMGLRWIPLLNNARFERGVRTTAARADRGLGKHAEAIRHADRAWRLARTVREQRESLRLLYIIEMQSGRTVSARGRLGRIRALDVKLGDPRGTAATDVQLAAADASLGRLVGALARIEGALLYFMKAEGRPGDLHGAHLNAADIWLQLRNAQRVHEHVEAARAAGILIGVKDPRLWVIEGNAFLLEHKLAEAERVFRLALPLLGRSLRTSRLSVQLHLAIIMSLTDRDPEAQEMVAAARAGLAPNVEPTERLRVEATAVFVYMRAGKLKRALEAGAVARGFNVPGMGGSWDAILAARLARAHSALGNFARALSLSEQAMTLVLRRSGGLPDVIGAQYRADLGSFAEVGIEAAGRLSAVDAVFKVSEQARAVAMRARLGEGELAFHGLAPALRDRGATLEDAERVAVTRYRQALPKGDAATLKQRLAAVARSREALERHRQLVRSKRSVAGQLLSPHVDDLTATRQALPTDTALVTFARGDRSLYAVVATRGAARLLNLGARADLSATLDAHFLDDPDADPAVPLAAFRRTLSDPLGLGDQIKHVRVVPAGRLAIVPFGALWPRRSVVMLPSATVARMLTARTAVRDPHVLAVGAGEQDLLGALPAVRTEVKQIGHRVLVGPSATEAALRAALAERPWRSVHIASHALIDRSHPLRSALSLLPSDQADGLYTVSEVMGTRLSSDLVVLSACSSGRGQIFEQEGTLGFAHAFLVAGARRVLVSLWNVDDEATAVLMKRFHAAWRPGVAPAVALRIAQASMRTEPRWRHPTYWAGWQLWGAP